MLSKLSVDHFKSLSQVEIDFGQITIICGKNSTGKSNILESLTFIRDAVSSGLEEATSDRHGIESILQWSRSRPYNMDMRVKFIEDLEIGSYHLKISSKGREPLVLDEHAYWNTGEGRRSGYERAKGKVKFQGLDDPYLSIARAFASNSQDQETMLKNMSIAGGRSNNPFSKLRRSLDSIELYSIFPNTIRNPQKPTSDSRLSPSGDNLLSILKTMSNSKASGIRNNYHEIISMMRQIIPNLVRIQVKNIGGLLWPLFDVSETDGKGHQFNVSQISDGALRILGILVALYQPNPPDVVALEEPEQNVHPGFLGLIADSFRDFSNHAQLIVTTHSPNLIDYFDIDNIYIAEFIDGQTTVGRVSRDQREAVKAKLLTAGELMSSQGLLVDKF